MNAISLFTGAMGFDLGIEYAGFNIRVCVEQDKWACQTIRKNKEIPLLEGDINSLSSSEILDSAGLTANEVDLIFGGPPCQPFSSAGKQKGLSDERSNTITKFISLVDEIKPKFFLLENVRGLLSAKLDDFIPQIFSDTPKASTLKGSALYYIVSEFNRIGYQVSFSLFNAANYGVPQKRERVILFGHFGKERIPLPTPTHYDYSSSTALTSTLKKHKIKPWVTIGESFNAWESPFESYSAINQSSTSHLPLRSSQIEYMELLKEGEYWIHLPLELQRRALGKAFDLGGGKTGFLRRLSYNKPSPTLVTVPTMPATLLCHPIHLRPLSIEEYARIQMFPESWTFEGDLSRQYKQIGNAVPVGLGYMAGRHLVRFLSEPIHQLIGEEAIPLKHSRYNLTTDQQFLPNFQGMLDDLVSQSEQMALF